MPNFQSLFSRHGEIGIQAMIEDFERREGTRAETWLPLEQRWDALLQRSSWADASAAGA
jgi:hypothetical protein